MNQQIYRFDQGDASMSDLLGGKGANLAEMTKLGCPVPPGLIIPTTVCQQYRGLVDSTERVEFVKDLVTHEVIPHLHAIQDELGHMPLLSVRSGAKFSMPGMMDTLLNIGLVSDNAKSWSDTLGALATLDCRRRQIFMYATTVEHVDPVRFLNYWNWMLTNKYGKEAPGTTAKMLKSRKHMQKIAVFYEKIFQQFAKYPFPDTLDEQLVGSVKAVFESWDSERAREYRALHKIDNDLGTAVTIQAMVFGNANDESCSGVAFTRDPATGEPTLMGEYVTNGQGEDVVAGADTGTDVIKPIAADTFPVEFPEAGAKLSEIADKLENHYGDMMDLEFTVENGKLWMLQCRVGKRTAAAAFRIAHDLHVEGRINKDTAVSRVSAKQYLALKKVRIQGTAPTADYVGIAAGGGLIKGHVVTTSEAAKVKGKDTPVILVRNDTTPEDFGGMVASVAILTRFGGVTSHAAVVGRSLEKVCVVGCSDLPDLSQHEGMITIDGTTGQVWLQDLPLTTGGANQYAETVFQWGLDLADTDVVLKTELDGSLPERCQVSLADAQPQAISEFLDKLDGNLAVDTVWINMEFPGEHEFVKDSALWYLTGELVSPASAEKVSQRMAAFLDSAHDEARAKVVLLPSPAMSEADVQQLRQAGWSVCARVATIEDLLDSDGAVEIDSEFAKSIGGEHVAEKLFALMNKAGSPVEHRPQAVSPRRLVFEVLK